MPATLEQGGVRGTRALVDVGCVELHGHGRQPKRRARHGHADGHRQQHGGHSDQRLGRGTQAGTDDRQAGGAADAVEAHGRIQEQSRGHQGQEEILEAQRIKKANEAHAAQLAKQQERDAANEEHDDPYLDEDSKHMEPPKTGGVLPIDDFDVEQKKPEESKFDKE